MIETTFIQSEVEKVYLFERNYYKAKNAYYWIGNVLIGTNVYRLLEFGKVI